MNCHTTEGGATQLSRQSVQLLHLQGQSGTEKAQSDTENLKGESGTENLQGPSGMRKAPANTHRDTATLSCSLFTFPGLHF